MEKYTSWENNTPGERGPRGEGSLPAAGKGRGARAGPGRRGRQDLEPEAERGVQQVRTERVRGEGHAPGPDRFPGRLARPPPRQVTPEEHP